MNIKEIKGNVLAGKKILVISGVHGNELTPIMTTHLLTQSELDLDLDKFQSLTIITGANNDAINSNTRDIPNSTTSDLNRMFKNTPPFSIKDELRKHLDANDVIIDIHSSPSCTEFVLLNQDENTNSYVEFCKEHLINYTIRYSGAETIKKYCLSRNRIAFTLELSGIGYVDYTSAYQGKIITKNIIENCSNFVVRQEEPVYSPYVELYTYKSGIFSRNGCMGHMVEEGDIIGALLDLDTLDTSLIKSPFKGMHQVICYGVSDYVDANSPICLLQPIKFTDK